jgi:hypothetical protein
MTDDRTPTDEAIDLIEPLLPTTCDCGYPHNADLAARLLDALPAGLHRRLADQKDGGPLFEGTEDELYNWLFGERQDSNIQVVVYPAAEADAIARATRTTP